MLQAFINGLELIWPFLLNVMSQVFNLYMTQPILMAIFSLWILDRVFHIFDLIKG